MRVGILSRGMPPLAPFFPEWDIVALRRLLPDAGGCDAVAGWGLKAPGRKAQALAEAASLPYLALEDGFLRSYDLGVRGAAPWSLVMDDRGIYYDASTPSRLEQLIAEGRVPEGAPELMARFVALGASKYNNSRNDIAVPEGPYLLLVDQCRDDASVAYGYGDADTFARMLRDAAAQGERLVVKTHPDVVSGARRGYLSELPLPPGTIVVDAALRPDRLFAGASAVYTVTSLLGMEALLHGRKVVTYGAPFYAGWGLTDDRALPPHVAARRTVRASLLQLFAAAYLHYPRYSDPYRGAPSSLGATLDLLEQVRAAYDGWPRRLHGWGFSRWKQPHVAPLLVPPGGSIHFHRGSFAAAKRAAGHDGAPLAVWAAKEPAEAAGVALLRVEDGFIRSRGLGSDLLPAHSLAVDAVGIYFDSHAPSVLEQRIEQGGFDAALLQRAADLRRRIVETGVSKYNLDAAPLPPLPADRPVHLVVGQVEDDASIRRGAGAIRSNAALLAAVRAAYPEAYLVYKPHPDVLAGNRAASAADRAAAQADLVLGPVALAPLLPQVARLHTISSLAGFEMLLAGGAVTTYGQPFYAGWGLTEDTAGPFPRRTRRATLDELAAAALILYPRYHDWRSGLPATAEQCVAALAVAQGAPPVRKSWRRQARRLKRWMRGLR